MNRPHRGFTLYEVIIVIGIMSALASVVYAGLSEARAKARDTDRYSGIRQLELALQAFASANDRYPSAVDGNCDFYNSFGPGGCLQILVDQGFFNELPSDPLNTAPHIYFYDNWCRDEDGNGFIVDTQYRLWTTGEQDHGATAQNWWNDETIGATTCEDPS